MKLFAARSFALGWLAAATVVYPVMGREAPPGPAQSPGTVIHAILTSPPSHRIPRVDGPGGRDQSQDNGFAVGGTGLPHGDPNDGRK